VSPFQPGQLVQLGSHCLARAALGFDLFLLAPPAIQHIVRNFKLPRHRGPRSARFPRESDHLGRECIGELTSRCCWPADLQFHDSPTYGSVYEIREGSIAKCHRTRGYECNNSMVGDLPLPYEDC